MSVVGGDVKHIAALENIHLNTPENNWEIYSNWADSIRSFPQITKEKARKISSLKFQNINILLNLLCAFLGVNNTTLRFSGVLLSTLLWAVAATVRACEGGPVRRGEEVLPAQSHRGVSC